MRIAPPLLSHEAPMDRICQTVTIIRYNDVEIGEQFGFAVKNKVVYFIRIILM